MKSLHIDVSVGVCGITRLERIMSQLHFKQMHVEAYCKNRFFSEAITPRKTLENSDIG